MNGNKHAYLVMCHNNFQILIKLLMALDDERNDIYIHVDKKTKNFPFVKISQMNTKAKLIYVNRKKVNWGGFSQIDVEMELLREATKTYHNYYHLLSGVDFPIKSQDYIHNFFDEHQGKEFIRFDPKFNRNNCDRTRYYYLLQDKIGRNKGKMVGLLYKIQNFSLVLQKKIHINRTTKCPYEIYKGTNWFSITHELAVFLVQKRREIKRYFSFGWCADELFVQTMVMESPFKNNIIDDSLRYIDWNRGNPYTFTINDYSDLTHNQDLFARKFDESNGMQIIDRLFEYIK